MRILAIDTTGPACSLALADFGARERVLGVVSEAMQRGHAEAIVPLLDALLKDAGAGRGSLKRIAVTVGPGSFTGLRVGLSLARGIALGLGIPALGISVFEAIREAAGPHGEPLAIALDARREEVYLQVFQPDGGTEGPAVVPLPDAAARVPAGARVVGTAASLLGHDSGPAMFPCDPLAIARLGARLDPQSAPPDPLYLRKPDAKPQTDASLARA